MARARVERYSTPDPRRVRRYVFTEFNEDGAPEVQTQGGLWAGLAPPPGSPRAGSPRADSQGPRINLVTAVRRTLEHELEVNPRVVVFGEDVGRKGGVHAATIGLQEKFGSARVFDTSLSEEGIIGRAVGMAAAGLMPVPEIQFRKYADPAAEQLNDCGTMRWRTANRFAAPMVVRIPGGFFKCGDPWHSQSNEVQWLHGIGWRVAMASNAEDAVGLLRAALRGNDPTIFFEHRSLLDGSWARRPYPGDDFVVEFGKAKLLREGTRADRGDLGRHGRALRGRDPAHRVVAPICWTCARCRRGTGRRRWHRCERPGAVSSCTKTPSPPASVPRSPRCSPKRHSSISMRPIERLAMPDIPSPHSPVLLDAVLPSVERICRRPAADLLAV